MFCEERKRRAQDNNVLVQGFFNDWALDSIVETDKAGGRKQTPLAFRSSKANVLGRERKYGNILLLAI